MGKLTKDKIVLRTLKRKVHLYCDKNIIIGGDFIVCLDPCLNKKDTVETMSGYCNNDVWILIS